MSDRDRPTMAEGGRKKGESKAGRRLTERERERVTLDYGIH